MADSNPLLEVCERLVKWLDRLAAQADIRAEKVGNFPSLREANQADARNYRATSADIRRAIKKWGESNG